MDRVKAYSAAKHNADKSVISAVHCLSVDSVYIMTIFVRGSLLQPDRRGRWAAPELGSAGRTAEEQRAGAPSVVCSEWCREK